MCRCVHIADVCHRHHEPLSGFQTSFKEKNQCESSLDLKLVTIDCLSLKVSDTGRGPRWWCRERWALPEVTELVPRREKVECL